jgi:hypothetical protein
MSFDRVACHLNRCLVQPHLSSPIVVFHFHLDHTRYRVVNLTHISILPFYLLSIGQTWRLRPPNHPPPPTNRPNPPPTSHPQATFSQRKYSPDPPSDPLPASKSGALQLPFPSSPPN